MRSPMTSLTFCAFAAATPLRAKNTRTTVTEIKTVKERMRLMERYNRMLEGHQRKVSSQERQTAVR